jgi:DNA-binding NarL/FixJ family response regulator
LPEVNITVCIVEDDAELRENISSYINASPGFKCLGAYGTAEEALTAIPRQNPQIAIVDINLPGMNGIQCVRNLAQILPALQITMFTVYEDTNRIFDALVAGACGYLLKSTPPEKLLEAIREIHQGGSPMTSHIARKVVQAFKPAASTVFSVNQLSVREQQVLDLLAQGYPYKGIAANMGLSLSTIRTYVQRIYEKLHVQCRTDAVVNSSRQQYSTGRRRFIYRDSE